MRGREAVEQCHVPGVPSDAAAYHSGRQRGGLHHGVGPASAPVPSVLSQSARARHHGVGLPPDATLATIFRLGRGRVVAVEPEHASECGLRDRIHARHEFGDGRRIGYEQSVAERGAGQEQNCRHVAAERNPEGHQLVRFVPVQGHLRRGQRGHLLGGECCLK
uniref:(northern house mosquito) hypothetical protein n=1 Tax=Culex pipiens TaxID=7175 RepID=A0A8D8N902_CULPI